MVLIYVMLGLGLNIVVGFAGLLTWVSSALRRRRLYLCLAVPLGRLELLGSAAVLGRDGRAVRLSSWLSAALRGDYLAIVTLGFGE